jgi:hypothetical protein
MAVLPQLFPNAYTALSGAPIIQDVKQHSGRSSGKKQWIVSGFRL